MEKARRLPPKAKGLRALLDALSATQQEASALQRAAVWTVVINRIEDLGFESAEALLLATTEEMKRQRAEAGYTSASIR